MTPTRRGGWLAGPPLLYLLIFVLVPLGLVASYSFRERDVDGGVLSGWSSDGWKLAIDEYTRTIVVRSLLLALGVTAGCVVLGYPCALALARLPARWRRAAVLLITFPLVTSLLLRIHAWKSLLPVEWRGELWSIGLVMTINYLPFMVLPLLRAIERMDENLPLAAMDLGATPWQTFWHVRWPLTRPGLLAGCALVFIPAAGDYLVPELLAEGRMLVLGTLIVRQFHEQRNWPFGAAASLWLLALVLVP